MNKYVPALLISAALLSACGDDHHANHDDQNALPQENSIGFSTQAEKLIATDKVMVDLAVVQRGTDTATLTQQINATTAEVMKIARESADVDSRTTGFMTNPYYDPASSYAPPPMPTAPDAPPPPAPQQVWEVSQGIHLESNNSKALSELIGKFQGKIQISNVSYDLSSATASAAKQELTSQAIKNFRERAKAIAKDMGYDEYRIMTMSVQAWDEASNTYGYASPTPSAIPMPMGSGSNISGNLVLEGGKQMYRLTVQGNIVVPGK